MQLLQSFLSSRGVFKEPDSGLPLKCDMCESDPPLSEPMCVQWCLSNALTYEEREEEAEEEVKLEEMETGLEALAGKYGLQKVHGCRSPDVKEGLKKAPVRGLGNTVENIADYKEIADSIKEKGGEAFKYCYQCGLCDTVCPWNRVRAFSMRKLIRQATFGLTEIENEEIWRCTTCGRCPQRCPRGVGIIEVGVASRRMATEFGVFPNAVRPVRGVSASLTGEGNPLNGERKDRANWAEGLAVKTFTEGMEVLYFPCCYLSYDPRLKKVARATATLLNKAGVDFGILGSLENCCGESIRKTGDEDLFKRLAKENIKTFIDNGVKKILVSSPHCYHAFKNEYSEFKVNFEVVHISQYLFELVESGKACAEQGV